MWKRQLTAKPAVKLDPSEMRKPVPDRLPVDTGSFGEGLIHQPNLCQSLPVLRDHLSGVTEFLALMIYETGFTVF